MISLLVIAATVSIDGSPLEMCSIEPRTGWFRDGYCRTDDQDRGIHVVCAEVTRDFLEYSAAQGNDLISPAPAHRFPGLKPGDRWCLCARRWEEARLAGVAPPVVLPSTHPKAATIVDEDELRAHAVPTP